MKRPSGGKRKARPAQKRFHSRARYSKAELLRLIRDVSQNDDGRLIFSRHALERMRQRGITDTEVMNLLESPVSRIPHEPEEDLRGDWRISIRGAAAGRDLEVAVAVKAPVGQGNIIVVTTIER